MSGTPFLLVQSTDALRQEPQQAHCVGDLQSQWLGKCHPVACSKGSHFELQKQVKKHKQNNLFQWSFYSLRK